MSTLANNLLTQIKDFGQDAAEQESSGNYLIQHFIQTETYRKAVDGSKSIIIGRKGAGKSAIFLYLKGNQEMNDGISRAFVVPDDISARKLIEFTGNGLTSQASKALAWKYVFLVLVARFVVEAANQGWGEDKLWPNSAKKIRKFLVDNEEMEDLKAVEKIARLASKIQPGNITIKVAALGELGIKQQEKDEGLMLVESIDLLEKVILEVFTTSLFSDKRLHIYVDQVDDVWSNDHTSNELVIGLLQAAQSVNMRFNGIRCVIFLRTDIYQVLEFHDKDKLHGSEVEIYWNEEGLVGLINERLSLSMKSDSNLTEQVFIGDVDGVSSLQYIISRTLMRPRDTIQFCNISLDIAKEKRHFAIEAGDILEAEEKYSRWKTEDIVGEYRVNYPFLNDILVVFANHLGFASNEFIRKDFSEKYSVIKDKIENRNSYLLNLTVDVVLAILYNIGFLGVKRGGKIAYKYSDPAVITDLDNEFAIHPAFWRYMGIKSHIEQENQRASDTNGNNKIDVQPEIGGVNSMQDGLAQEPKPEENKPAQEPKPEENKPSQETKAAPKKETPRIMAGTGEVKTAKTKSDFGKIYDTILKIQRVLSIKDIKYGKATAIKVNACLEQANQKMRVLDINYEPSYDSSDRGAFVSSHSSDIIYFIKLISVCITEIEKIDEERMTYPISLAQERLTELLQDSYNLFVEEYYMDILNL